MVAHDRLAKEINSQMPGLMNQLIINLLFAVIIVSACDLIVSRQKATMNGPVHHMNHSNFVTAKHSARASRAMTESP